MPKIKYTIPTKVEEAMGAEKCYNNHAFAHRKGCIYCGRTVKDREESCIQGIFRDATERELMTRTIEELYNEVCYQNWGL